jgi:hypothetical protein
MGQTAAAPAAERHRDGRKFARDRAIRFAPVAIRKWQASYYHPDATGSDLMTRNRAPQGLTERRAGGFATGSRRKRPR